MRRSDGILAATALFALGCGNREPDPDRIHSQLCWGTRHALGASGARGHVEDAIQALATPNAPGNCVRYNQSLQWGKGLITGFKLGVLAWNDRPDVKAILDALRIPDNQVSRSAEEEMGDLSLECIDRIDVISEDQRNETATRLRRVVVQLDAAVSVCPVDPRELQSPSVK